MHVHIHTSSCSWSVNELLALSTLYTANKTRRLFQGHLNIVHMDHNIAGDITHTCRYRLALSKSVRTPGKAEHLHCNIPKLRSIACTRKVMIAAQQVARFRRHHHGICNISAAAVSI